MQNTHSTVCTCDTNVSYSSKFEIVDLSACTERKRKEEEKKSNSFERAQLTTEEKRVE